MQRVDLFTSHEGLHLPYEEAITRSEADRWYNLSTHFPWIGARTAMLGGAHIEYFRGIANPIGIKVAASTGAEACLRVLDILDPHREPGRITLIHRFGVDKVRVSLPDLIRAVKASGRQVVWCCDPMHGNTKTTSGGIKTRHFADILSEVAAAFDVHAAEGTYLGGVHLELSGEDVTECIGGASGITESDLARAYKSDVDPRLNYEQALEVAMLIAHHLRSNLWMAVKDRRLKSALRLVALAFAAETVLWAGELYPAARFTNPQRLARLEAALPEIDDLFRRYAESKHIPGMVWGVVIDGRLAHVQTIGDRITADTAFRIASMTKSFTALAILKLRDEGKLSLEDPVAKWIPEFSRMEMPDWGLARASHPASTDAWGRVSGRQPLGRPATRSFGRRTHSVAEARHSVLYCARYAV